MRLAAVLAICLTPALMSCAVQYPEGYDNKSVLLRRIKTLFESGRYDDVEFFKKTFEIEEMPCDEHRCTGWRSTAFPFRESTSYYSFNIGREVRTTRFSFSLAEGYYCIRNGEISDALRSSRTKFSIATDMRTLGFHYDSPEIRIAISWTLGARDCVTLITGQRGVL